MSGRRAKHSPAAETTSSAQNNALSSHKIIEIKSKFDAEFRRFSVDLATTNKADSFYDLVSMLHKLKDIPFLITYSDKDGDQLPINNDDNYMKALSAVKGLLRLQIQRKGETPECGFGTLKKKKRPISMFMGQESTSPRKALPISFPEDFRQVSAIIDVDIVPQTHRRVRLIKNGQEKPLGFYIRDGVSVRVTPHGLEKVPGIFISRLVPGGLAESTGLLAVNDEVLEVNGIEVTGKSLDQVTDMMVANSSNLIITVKPINEANTLAKPSRAPSKITGPMNKHSRTKSDQGASRGQPDVIGTHKRTLSNHSDEVRDLMKDDEDDEVTDHTQASLDKLSLSHSSHSQSQSANASSKPAEDADDDDDSMTL